MKWLLLLTSFLAAFFDLKERRVPGRLIFAALTGEIVFLCAQGLPEAGVCAAALRSGIFTGIVVYSLWKMRMLGAGDAKLFLILSVGMPERRYLFCCLPSLLIGSVWSVAVMIRCRNAANRFRTFAKWLGQWGQNGSFPVYMKREDYSSENTIPFAAAVFSGYLVSILMIR